MTDSASSDPAPLGEVFPFLQKLPRAERDQLDRECSRVILPPERFICMAGDRCTSLPLVIRGSARVYTMSQAGREVTLYRIGPGESCILTAGCLLDDLEFPAFARTETETAALMVPAPLLQDWLESSPLWSRYVLSLVSKRLSETIGAISDLVFTPLERRLAGFLLETSDSEGICRRTHAEIAAEVGSTREAVSRCLKRFERADLVAPERGAVRLLDRDALAARTAGSSVI